MYSLPFIGSSEAFKIKLDRVIILAERFDVHMLILQMFL